jgi:hypothetical protein
MLRWICCCRPIVGMGTTIGETYRAIGKTYFLTFREQDTLRPYLIRYPLVSSLGTHAYDRPAATDPPQHCRSWSTIEGQWGRWADSSCQQLHGGSCRRRPTVGLEQRLPGTGRWLRHWDRERRCACTPRFPRHQKMRGFRQRYIDSVAAKIICIVRRKDLTPTIAHGTV